MDNASAEYILAMDRELQDLVNELSRKAASKAELDERIEVLQKIAFRAGLYWDMTATIKDKTWS